MRKNRYSVIRQGKAWWKHLDKKDKKVLIEGFIKNENAEEIQKKETEFNLKKRAIL